MPTNTYFVYLVASQKNGTIYIGVTNDIERRTFEHRKGLVSGFTQKYNIKVLVYFEEHNNIESAIRREKQIKKWKRSWKIYLIEKENPHWNDLAKGWFDAYQ